jgi:glycosyltransferase involved in cell wall biosynthesis
MIDVLFMHAQDGFGADAAVHAGLMQALDRRDFRVHVACTAGADGERPVSFQRYERIDDIQLRPTRFLPGLRQAGAATQIPARLLASASELGALRRYVRTNRIRIVHGSDRPRDASYTVALAKLCGIKSVVHVHVKWSSEYSAPSRWGVRHADACFGISQYVTQTIISSGKPASRVHTVLNAIDPSRFDPSIRGDAIRREFSIPDGAPLLASVSRLFSWKGQRELLRALAIVKAERPDVRLLIVGADELEVGGGSFSTELRRLAGELGLTDQVVFTGQRSDIPEIMAACDVFTLPSFEEPFGLVFLEAMAMKKPVVAIDNGGTPEVVEHGQSGLLSPAWDVQALAANISTLLADPALRASMGERGREQMLAKFTPQRMANDASAAYRAVLGEQRSAAIQDSSRT